MKPWLKHLLWMIGMLLLLVVSFHLQHAANTDAQRTFHITRSIWTNTAISFALGLYLSLLFIQASFRPNKSLLVFVFIPCTLGGLSLPLAVTFPFPIPLWVSAVNTHDFLTVLSGLSLMTGLFRRQAS